MSQPPDVDATGARIEALLTQIGEADAAVAELAEDVVRELISLYGAGLARILDVVRETTDHPEPVLRGLAGDELLEGLLALHDLHPVGVRTRVEEALDKVRPYLGSHGGDVEVLDVDGDVVRLRLVGSCDGCPSSQATLEHAVEGAIMRAAPELSGIEVQGAAGEAGNGLISAESLSRQRNTSADDGWTRLEVPPALAAQTVAALDVAGAVLVICRSGDHLYAYRDPCPACGASLAAADLTDAWLTCDSCGHGFDVQRAGRPADGGERHLAPVPLVSDDHGVWLAISTSEPTSAAVGTSS